MSFVRRLVGRSARLRALGRGVRDAVRGPGTGSAANRAAPSRPTGRSAPSGPPDPSAGVPELHRVTARPSAAAGGPRLSLLLPTLEPNRTYGGARTALDLFEALADAFPRRRIVAFHPVSEAAMTGLDGYRLADADDDPVDDRLVVAAPRGAETSLAVGPEDAFLATFWTTAELAIRLVRWQAAEFERPVRPFGYLVQDFEPGFYPWSAQSELARATYAGEVPTIAIFNSGALRDYFSAEGLRFERDYTFEPRLSPELRRALEKTAAPRLRRIVAYGRPETPRNAFPLIVEGLRAWAAADPEADGWTAISVGRQHPPVELGRGLRLRSFGKLDIAAYGSVLRESAVGLSLMISPHPSYPPLEMAHLGMLVVTNRFATKDLGTWHENITSIEELTAEGIAAALSDAIARFDADPTVGDRGRPLRDEYLGEGPPFPFASELAALLGAPALEAQGAERPPD